MQTPGHAANMIRLLSCEIIGGLQIAQQAPFFLNRGNDKVGNFGEILLE